jgi:hypothetical protein
MPLAAALYGVGVCFSLELGFSLKKDLNKNKGCFWSSTVLFAHFLTAKKGSKLEVKSGKYLKNNGM